MAKLRNIFVLFPMDLYHNTSYIKDASVFLVEEPLYFDRCKKDYGSMKFNILKPIYHRATMRCYYDNLIKQKIKCKYIEFSNDWIDIVKTQIKEVTKDGHVVTLKFFDPVDRNLEAKLKRSFASYDMINTPRFILSTEELEEYDGALRQTSFYFWIRKLKNIMMDDNSKPIGGKMTYDNENRKKPYDGIEDDVDDAVDKNDDPYVKEATKYVKQNLTLRHYNIFGDIDMKNVNDLNDTELVIKFPIDRSGSLKRLRYFIKNNLARFGDCQDVMLNDENNSFVFHSALSPMINVGLLTPEEVISEVLKTFNALDKKNKTKTIHNVEGFIRQILGWREFTRFMYQYHSHRYLNKNYFSAKKTLNNSWYDGTTGIEPIDNCIKKAFKFGYLHHIERLMIVSNYMTLSGISPREMLRWFTEFSLDSYDWVMEYNVLCMASYSDGGQFTSKPYISSSKYILSMSNYRKKRKSEEEDRDKLDWTKKWDEMFWAFMKRHKEKIKKIGRLSMLLKYIDKKK
jgi:deoxyribodipyrimidine photolyase-related protein